MILRAACLTALLAATAPALAADPPMVNLGIGATDVVRQGRAAGDLRLEYRSGLSLLALGESAFKLKPWAGVETTTRQSLWAGGGFVLEIPLGAHWVLSPSFGIGEYVRGNGSNLGSGLEFRSQVEGGYVFANQTRLVAAFSHMSNAGATRHNQGTEAAVVSYQLPLRGWRTGQ